MSLFPHDEMLVVCSHIMQIASRISHLASPLPAAVFMCRKPNLGADARA